jgi:hypothetical protein
VSRGEKAQNFESHEWARRGEIDPEELTRQPLLGGESGTGTGGALRRTLGPLADGLKVQTGYGSTEGVKRAVRASSSPRRCAKKSPMDGSPRSRSKAFGWKKR